MDGRPRADDGDRDSRNVGDSLLARRILPPAAARDCRRDDARLALVIVVDGNVRPLRSGTRCIDRPRASVNVDATARIMWSQLPRYHRTRLRRNRGLQIKFRSR